MQEESESIQSHHLIQMLRSRFTMFGPTGVRRYLIGEEVGHKDRWADMIVQDTWAGGRYYGDPDKPYNAYPRHGFEVKVSRSDWLNELRDPSKAEAFRPYCHFWSLVIADKSMVREGELPEGWGLLVPRGKRLFTIVKALENFDMKPIPPDFMIGLMRRIDQNARGER